jgi:dihydrodipicolinate reductase
MIKVGVLGALGRMGAEVVKAVNDSADCQLVAALDQGDSLDALVTEGVQVVVDFTTFHNLNMVVVFSHKTAAHCLPLYERE